MGFLRNPDELTGRKPAQLLAPTNHGDRMSARNLCFVALSSLLAVPLAAQTGSLSGHVLATNGRTPLVAVRIQVVSGAKTVAATSTGEDGAYRIGIIPTGTYDVVASRIGYTPLRRTAVAMSGAMTIDFEMQAASTPLDAVVATASRKEEKALDAPAQITVISEERVEERATVTLAGH